MNQQRLVRDLRDLSRAYDVIIDDNYEYVAVMDFNLPPGYNKQRTCIKLVLPRHYPEEPPGIGRAQVFVPADLRYKGRRPADFHESVGPEGWAWWCYQRIDWDPRRDNLITFFELLRAHMTNPK